MKGCGLNETLIVLALLTAAAVLLVTERLRPDLVAMLILAALVVLRILGPAEALAGFSNPATITVACMFVISAGLQASGVVHWLADRHFDPETPILGSLLIAPFREHHRAPDAITQHGFLEVTGNNALVTLPLALALLVHPAPAGSHAWLLVHLTLIALAASVFATNPIHRWAHLETPPGWVRLLQRGGLVLSPEAHAEHHGPRHDRAYCVTSGWLNPLLDRVGFFRALDRAVERAASLRTLRRSGAP